MSGSKATSPPAITTVCTEVFDDKSLPSEEEVRDYAIRLGIEPDAEPQLLLLARDGLMQALPSGWTPCFDHKRKAWYYYNFKTGTTQWEHPLDPVYRDLVRKSRSESASSAGEEDSKTSAKEDLKSYEEAALLSLDGAPKQMDSLKPSSALLRRGTTQLAPLKKLPSRLEPGQLSTDNWQKSLGGVIGPPRPPPSPTPPSAISTVPSILSTSALPNQPRSDDRLLKAQEKHPKSMHGHTELTLSGGGTSFLKKPLTPSSDSSLSDGQGDAHDSGAVAVWVKPASNLTPPRGILRDKSPQRLWDSDPRDMNSKEKQTWQRQELEEERKSVRFNLEEGDGLQIRFLEEDEKITEPQGVVTESVTIRLETPSNQDLEDAWNSEDEDPFDEEEVDEDDIAALPTLEVEEESNDVINKDPEILELIQEDAQKSTESLANEVKVAIKEDSDIDHQVQVESLRLQASISLEEEKKQIEAETTEFLMQLRQRLKNEEELEQEKLTAEMKKRLTDLEASLQRDLEARESHIREGAEKKLEELREKLATDMERDLAKVRAERKALVAAEMAELESSRLASDAKLSALREEMSALLKEKECEEKERLEQESIAKLIVIKEELATKEEKQISEINAALNEQREQKLEDLKKELSIQEEVQLANMKSDHKKILAEKVACMEKSLEKEVTLAQQEMAARLAEAMIKVRAEEDRQLTEAKEVLAKEHNKAVDKLRTEQLLGLEKLRASLQKEEEELHATHKARVAGLSDKLNSEYELRLKRLRDLAERKGRLLEEEERTTAKLESQSATPGLRSSDIDNSSSHQLQRQVELLSIKLRESRKQLEEARASRMDDRVFEKLRCEKRLLEDKYRTLKDKYVRLKADVKQSLDKRNKKRLAAEANRAGAGATTTGSETERSTSQKQVLEKPARKPLSAEESILEASESNNNNTLTDMSAAASGSHKESLLTSPPPTDSSDRTSPPPPPAQLRRARRHQTKLKSSSTPRLDRGRDTASPVEILRTQLKKLEDLEDLFPASTHTDTYLRYPFPDSGQVGSCELEFFRHRIHLERDSVRRAKDFLRQQRRTFAGRQHELRTRQEQLNSGQQQQQHTSGRLHSELMRDSILQEERELSDMEVSLHRTRSLLGEKIIRLRQLEHSLQQASSNARPAPTDATLSDLSSHSGSSGFSSNENPSEGPALKQRLSPATAAYQDSSEIVRSLETLNAEIRSLWDLLQRQNAGQQISGPPPLLAPGSETPWPALATLADQLQHIRLQQQVTANNSLAGATAATLAERAQGLRDWLRRARLDSTHLATTTQATL